jgi:hypothetical protein
MLRKIVEFSTGTAGCHAHACVLVGISCGGCPPPRRVRDRSRAAFEGTQIKGLADCGEPSAVCAGRAFVYGVRSSANSTKCFASCRPASSGMPTTPAGA